MPEANLNSDDFYKILGIEKGASEKEIKMAYRKAALKWHPDKNADNKEKAEENFKKITEAYEVLSDKDKRQTYDRFGKQAVSGNGAGGPGGFSSGGGMTSAHADEIFKAFFGGGDPFGGDDPFAGMMGGMGGPGGGSFVFNMGAPGGGGVSFGGPGGMGGGMGGMGGGHPFGGMMGGMGGGNPFGGMGGGMQQPKRRRVERCDLIPDQQKVTIMGLQSRAELNDTTGVVVDFNEQSGRYVVKTNIAATGGQGEQLSLKPDNLTLRVEKAKFVDIQAKPELNETEAMVIKYDTGKDRYQILSKKTNSVMSVSVGNVALPVGTRVMMFGLTGSPQYNGKWGKISETCMGERKYLVQVGQNKNIKIKFSACRCSG